MRGASNTSLALSLATSVFVPLPVAAWGTYANRPIRLIVAFPPGGTDEVFTAKIGNEVARLLQLKETLNIQAN